MDAKRMLRGCGLLALALVGQSTGAVSMGALTAVAQPPIQQAGETKGIPMIHAAGTFDVKMAPISSAGAALEPGLAAYTLDKTYHGELDASGKGQMLSGGNPASGNAGYVAIEMIAGTLAGKKGTFAVMQMGIMSTGTEPTLTAKIVPGSGTGELSGIYGSMTIVVASGKHSYTLDYAFAK